MEGRLVVLREKKHDGHTLRLGARCVRLQSHKLHTRGCVDRVAEARIHHLFVLAIAHMDQDGPMEEVVVDGVQRARLLGGRMSEDVLPREPGQQHRDLAPELLD